MAEPMDEHELDNTDENDPVDEQPISPEEEDLPEDSSWEATVNKRFADLPDEKVVALAQQGDSVAVEY
ncbi:MAG: hypothetical protein RR821_10785, partial [Clostridia bacterium]